MKSRAIRKIAALVIIAALAVTMAFALAACNEGGGGLGSGDIAILVPSADHGWTGAILSNANAWAEEINAEGKYSARVITATGDDAQKSQIEDIAANKNYKAVVILPYSNAVESSMKILASSGIPFIMVDRIIDSVIESINRNEGFYAALAKHGITENNTTFEQLPSTNWSRDTGKQNFIDFVNGQADFADYDFIFTHDSELSMGIFEALNESGIDDAKKSAFYAPAADGQKVVLASSSGLDEAYSVLRGEKYQDIYGKLADFFDVTYPPEMIATALDLMVEYLDNGSVANDAIVVEVDAVDATNVDEFKGFK